ncbi:MAG: glutathione S-transferase family protein [Solirubrobacteraceae bacterium]|nr:glutathione S-transferase family protein [Solirubrobacteraceae bacterium]
MSYVLNIANKNHSSWSLRAWVLMRALGIPFEERLTAFVEGGSAATFRAFSPSGKVPVLIDGERVVWDSLAITEYLAERHATVWPVDIDARAWARSAAAEMHSGFDALRTECSLSCAVRMRLHAITPGLQRDLDRLCELWGEGLVRFGGPFLAGSAFTAVDAFFAPVAFRIQTFDLPLDPAALAYAEHLRGIPAMREWYEAAVVEPLRDPDHDEELAHYAELVEDLRV